MRLVDLGNNSNPRAAQQAQELEQLVKDLVRPAAPTIILGAITTAARSHVPHHGCPIRRGHLWGSHQRHSPGIIPPPFPCAPCCASLGPQPHAQPHQENQSLHPHSHYSTKTRRAR